MIGSAAVAISAVALAQHYAQCIRRLHPDPLTPDQALALKVAIVIMILSAVAGSILGWRDYDGPFMGALKGFTVSMISLMALIALWVGVRYVLS